MFVLQGAQGSLDCNLDQPDLVSCSNGMVGRATNADTFVLSNGVKVAPGSGGTLVLSNGIVANRASAGWIHFSTGIDARREGRRVKFSNGATCVQPGELKATCVGP